MDRSKSGSTGSTLPFSISPRIKQLMQKEKGIGIALLAHVEAEYRNDPLGQIGAFYRRFYMPSGTGREREASIATHVAYITRMNVFVKALAEMNMPILNLSAITARQVRHVFKKLEREGYSSSYLCNLNTTIRRFGVWVGKCSICPPTSQLLDDPVKAKRSYTAIVPKSWQSNGISPEKVIAQVDSICEVTSLHLQLMHLFGMRVLEAIRLRVADARIGEAHLLLTDGTKGGRPRTLDITTQSQRELLNRIAAMSKGSPTGHLMHKQTNDLKQSMRHFYSVMEKVGITKGDLGVTAHGLRHGHFCDIYLRITGAVAPVLGGGKVAPVLHKQAVDVIKKSAGHGRDSVVAAYAGNHRTLSRLGASNLGALLNAIRGDETVVSMARPLGLESLAIIGSAALGKPIRSGEVLSFAYQAARQLDESQEEADDRVMARVFKVVARIGHLLGSPASAIPMKFVGFDSPKFELTPLT